MELKTKLFILIAVLASLLAVVFIFRAGGPEPALTAAFDAEFLSRSDGYPGLAEHYGFKFPSPPMQMDPGLMYGAVHRGSVDVIDAFATDGRIEAYDLVVIEDDKNFFPPYHAAPLIREETLKKFPELEEILNRLSGKITGGKMRELNYRVDEKREEARDVAVSFLKEQGLISEANTQESARGPVTIGGKHFTEQEILGEIMAAMIEHNSNIKVIRKLNLGGTIICFNALKAGDLDLYAEYTGTGLVNILGEEAVRDAEAVYKTVAKKFKEKYNIMWLEPFGFDNTYTLTMRRNHAEELGIKTITDIAQYIKNN
jgi:osmoprotectant transport system permease protein